MALKFYISTLNDAQLLGLHLFGLTFSFKVRKYMLAINNPYLFRILRLDISVVAATTL